MDKRGWKFCFEKLAGSEDVEPFVNANETKSEWIELKAAMVNHSNLQKSSSVEELLQQLHLNHADDFPNLLRIADWGLAISLSTADCERDFSLLKLV